MTIASLAKRVLDQLRADGAIDSTISEGDYRYEQAVQSITHALGPGPRARKMLPDRNPDFVFWVDHEGEGTAKVTVNCLPSQIATVGDWVAVAEWMLHEATKRLAMDQKTPYVLALHELIRCALEYTETEHHQLRMMLEEQRPAEDGER